MKKKDVYKLRSIIEQLRHLDADDRNSMQKDQMRPLWDEAIKICNDCINKMKL